MEKITINLENCYGIKKLTKELDFSNQRTIAIYAPNGVMKTSFAKTFKDISAGLDSKDLIFSSRKTVREIRKEDESDINKEEVFVVEPYNEIFESEKMSTLLVNKDLKKRYDEIHSKIDAEKDKLVKELKALSGLRDSNEKEISETFTGSDNNFFISLLRIKDEVLDEKVPEFSDISYKEVFNEKVISFLRTKDFKKKITEYIKKYNDLVESSRYFKKGVFNHNNATVIAKSLMDNGFFEAEHTISLNAKEGKREIRTKNDLEKIIEEEKSTILNNPDLLRIFEELDSKMRANKELRDFRDYLLNNLKILTELENLEVFRKKIWISYLKTKIDWYQNLINLYQAGEAEIDEIVKRARAETTRWKNVIDIFNKRFFVPFKLEIRNRDDVILKRDIPIIAFIFKDSDEESAVEKTTLLQVLSKGEQKALYILNIIFEVEARKNDGQETLFIIDDIADSFDYKNKYAIIEYLMDISEDPNFHQIILTHNFDFFRTVQSRFVSYSNCLMVEKTRNETTLVKASYIKNPFKAWVSQFDDDKKLIASIPFVRNLVEYTKGLDDENYLKLTALLHMKMNTVEITKNDLVEIYKVCLPQVNLTQTSGDRKIIELIFDMADSCLVAAESANLENKIILSIAIRLKAEKFILSKVVDKSEISKNQTINLIKKYKIEFKHELIVIELLERVNLMTPENIHFNSFMYEPILDMSDEHLKNLYSEIKDLTI